MNGDESKGMSTMVAIIGIVVLGVMAAICGFAAMSRQNNVENVSPACPGYNNGVYSGLNYMSDPVGSQTGSTASGSSTSAK